MFKQVLLADDISKRFVLSICVKPDGFRQAILYTIAKRKPDDTSELTEVEKYHRGDMRPILLKEDIEEHITKTIGEIDVQIEGILKKGSGYILELILEIFIEIYTLRRALGGSFNPTPPKLANSKCTINPDNQGLIDPEINKPSEKCLQGALGAYFAYLDGHTDHLGWRIFRAKNLKPYLEQVKLYGIPMPTPVSHYIFNKIKEMNPDISVNVWNWKEETATPKPVIYSKNYNRPHIIHLMALTDITKSKEGKYGQKNHFLWIKNPDGLVYKDNAYKVKKHLCNRCFQSFTSEKSLDHHQEWCFGLGEAPQRVTMPVKEVNDFKEFRNYGRQINAPCVIIADFESLKKKCDTHYGGNMRKLAEEEANSFSYSVHWIDTGETWGPFLYRGENATEEFEADRCWICEDKFSIDTDVINMLERKIANLTAKLTEIVQDPISYNKMASPRDISKRILEMEKNNVLEKDLKNLYTELLKAVKNPEDYKSLKSALSKAQTDLSKEEARDKKVWDHCHITGEFRGASHNSCNLKLQIEPWKTPIPVIFHNFRGYDSHLVCESIRRSANSLQISVIAETFERYKSIKVGQLKYIDSMQFMNSSLANLTKNLGDNHPITTEYFKKQGYTTEQISLAYRKGVFPYEYITSHDRFKETELPPIQEFHSVFGGKISQEDYEHAQKVWKEFGCKNLGEYNDLYLKIDVLSLADVWTTFRKTSMHHYGLDPSHYVSAPSLSWDAMLKMTKVKIELFTEMAMHDFIEKAKRGGIAMAVHRHFKANNPSIGEEFDPSQPTTWISYVDANNLYGWAMSQFLPVGNYKWVASREYLKNNPKMQKKYLEMILKTRADAQRGFFLMINSHFP
ncbi:hypothetical protein RclHR1_27070004 [Rhizophagus clarus]|uniref:C2H2-type domain-containing protein n=1 Tax=Rhizophagus clarus TaxID=94130 RepID=A0A2Z6RW40_9GLOM|nr:hypothetical protein RclHR1_27070004 [Rhizophagus clarus]